MKLPPFLLFLFISFSAVGQEATLYTLSGYGGNSVDQIGKYVIKTDDGGFVVGIGSSSSIGTGNIDSFCAINGDKTVFLKYTSMGVLEWTKCYSWSGDSACIMFPISNNGSVLCGQFDSDIGWGFLIQKQDAAGTVQWQRNYSKGNGAIFRGAISTNDGGYIMLGESLYTDTNVSVHYGSFMDPDLWLLRVDSNGNKVWSIVIGGTGYESGAALVTAPGDGCYVVGGTGSNDYDCTGSHGGGEVYVARVGKAGNLLWHRDIGGSLMDVGMHACDNGKGGVLIAGQTRSNDGDIHNYHGDSDYFIVELDSSNNVVWTNCYGSAGYEIPFAICRATDGSVWINGASNTQGGDVSESYGAGDAWVVHTDNIGNIINTKVLGSTHSVEQDEGTMIYPLSNSFVIAGGYYAKNNGVFSSLTSFGTVDAFLATLAPWSTSVQQTAQEIPLRIFPTPATDKLYLQYQATGRCSITVRDVLGHTVFHEPQATAGSQRCIDVSTYARGIYYVQLVSNAGNTTVQKIVLQ